MLRQRLIFGVPPERVAETLRELGVSEPEAVRDRAPQDWMLRRLTAATESVVSNRTITNFDDLSGLQHPGLDYLTVKPKLQPATVLREHRARR